MRQWGASLCKPAAVVPLGTSGVLVPKGSRIDPQTALIGKWPKVPDIQRFRRIYRLQR